MAGHSASPFEHGEGDDDYLLHGSEPYVTNHRHLNELHRLSAFQQVTTKVPPSYDGRSSWFAYEDAIDDWCDITELDNEKRGPALRNRLEGEAAIDKRLLDRDRLKDPNNGVKYFKSFLRPLFVKGAANVFLYRFQQFRNLHRGNGDMLRWITRFQLSIQRTQEAWNDTYLPITGPNNAKVRAYIAGLPAEEQGEIAPEVAMQRANARLQDQHARTIPITANLVALKGGKGSGGRRFFKKSKGRSNLADDQTDAWQAEGQWQDSQWHGQSWDDWPWYESEEAYAAKGKGKKGKKGKGT